MRVNSKVVIDLATGAVIERESHEYSGPIAECISFGGSKSKSKNQSQQSSSSESGTNYNEDFLRRARLFAAGKELDANGNIVEPSIADPGYNPEYVSVAPEGFDKYEKTLYEGQQSKLQRAHDEAVARQREELAQMGALNSPSQYLEGSARSSLDRNYMEGLQQAARDAFTGRMGLEEREAGRRTSFNEQTAARLLELWLKKLGIAAQTGQYSKSSGQGTSQGSGSGSGFNFGLFNFGGSQTNNANSD